MEPKRLEEQLRTAAEELENWPELMKDSRSRLTSPWEEEEEEE